MLTNKIREYYQIKPINPGWKEIELKNGYGSKVLIDKKNVLHKFIMDNSDEESLSYREIDYNIQLTSDYKIIGKTGKAKGLSYSVLEKMKPANKYFQVSGTSIDLYNFDNGVNVLFDYNLNLKSGKDVVKYIENRIKNPSIPEKEEFEAYKINKKQKLQSIKSGDIFRIKLCHKQFAYGRVIADLDRFRNYTPPFISKLNIDFRGTLIFDKVLITPALIDLFLLRTDDPFLTPDRLAPFKTTPSLIEDSGLIKRNVFKVIGNAKIDISSFDIPMSWETYYQYKPISHIFKWGAGIKTFAPVKRLEKLAELTYPMNYNAIHLGANEKLDGFLSSCMAGNPNFKYVSSNGDLREPLFAEVRKIISDNIQFDIDKGDYDDFARKFGFMTKAEIISFSET